MESHQPAVLEYEVAAPVPWWKRLPRWWRYPFIGAVTILGSYLLGLFRTMDYGTTLRGILAGGVICAVATAPFIAPTFFDSNRRRAAARWLLVIVSCVALSEAWAISQEVVFERKCAKRPTVAVWENRWWPYEDHNIGYDPPDNFYGGD